MNCLNLCMIGTILGHTTNVWLALQLESEGHKCTSIQGGMEHSARDRVIEEFRTGTTKILISTDVLARGFDVTQARFGCGLHTAAHPLSSLDRRFRVAMLYWYHIFCRAGGLMTGSPDESDNEVARNSRFLRLGCRQLHSGGVCGWASA